MGKLSQHFSLSEFTVTKTGLPNDPPPEAEAALRALCEHVLEPIRALLGCPLRVTSGYRSPAVNVAIRGSKTSQHMRGEAADIDPLGVSAAEAMERVAAEVKAGRLVVDQLIWYPRGEFLHVSYSAKRNRGQLLRSLASGGSGGPYRPFVLPG